MGPVGLMAALAQAGRTSNAASPAPRVRPSSRQTGSKSNGPRRRARIRRSSRPWGERRRGRAEPGRAGREVRSARAGRVGERNVVPAVGARAPDAAAR